MGTDREKEKEDDDDDDDDGQFARCFSALNEEEYLFLNRAAAAKAQS